MRRTGKKKDALRRGNFLVAAAVLIVCNVAIAFITSWHLALLVIPGLIAVSTIVLLVLMRAATKDDTGLTR